MTLTRREAVLAGAAALALPALAPRDPKARFVAGIRKLERGIGGDARIGVQLIDPVTGRNAAWRAAERFPMCSTFKLLLVGQVLQRIDRGIEHPARDVAIPATTFPNSPATRDHAGGRLPVRELCAAAMTQSDNTAANLLLESVGGPAALTRFLRSTGDAVTRLDRFETALNEGAPGDPRDTSTPAAMLDTMRRLTVGQVLAPASRKQLLFWMANTVTGADKLRKGLPADWAIGDRTGAGGHNSNNDIGLIWPAGRPPARPLFVTAFVTGGPGGDALARNPVHAAIGKLIVELLGPA
ncbi:MAG: class A beta-lactamase [Sphingomonas sp.]|uniref:class A beta-lactamase n=1 Tax=Sphingomonas sp. TaxID=28214 RepID=UPI003F806436